MAEELFAVLVRFHREFFVPDVQRIVASAVVDLRGEMLSHFDDVYQRFDRLESESRELRR